MPVSFGDHRTSGQWRILYWPTDDSLTLSSVFRKRPQPAATLDLAAPSSWPAHAQRAHHCHHEHWGDPGVRFRWCHRLCYRRSTASPSKCSDGVDKRRLRSCSPAHLHAHSQGDCHTCDAHTRPEKSESARRLGLRPVPQQVQLQPGRLFVESAKLVLQCESVAGQKRQAIRLPCWLLNHVLLCSAGRSG